jgi:hypothetical protein
MAAIQCGIAEFFSPQNAEEIYGGNSAFLEIFEPCIFHTDTAEHKGLLSAEGETGGNIFFISFGKNDFTSPEDIPQTLKGVQISEAPETHVDIRDVHPFIEESEFVDVPGHFALVPVFSDETKIAFMRLPRGA